MSESDFVQWLKGFSQGVHHYSISPAQWDYLKEKLSTVGKQHKSEYVIDKSIWTTTIA